MTEVGKMRKKIIALLLGALMLFTVFSGCSSKREYSEYDVTGYFQALFNSSYKAEHTEYAMVAKITTADAAENNNVVVQNMAVSFCNKHNILPSDQQLAEIEDIMRQSIALADIQAKAQQKTETGYTINVEIKPISTFMDMDSEIADALRKSKDRVLPGQVQKVDLEESSQAENGDDDYDSDDDDYDGDSSYEEGDESLNSDLDDDSSESSSVQPSDEVDDNTAFVNEVIRLLNERFKAGVTYDPAVTVELAIILTDKGELQVDWNQIDLIDETILYF